MSRHTCRGSFSWVELLAIMMVMMLVAGMVFPITSHHPSREARRRVACADNLRQMAEALHHYAVDAQGYLPADTGAAGPVLEVRQTFLEKPGVRRPYRIDEAGDWTQPGSVASARRAGPLVITYRQAGQMCDCPSALKGEPLDEVSHYRYCGNGLKIDDPRATSLTIVYDQSGNHPDNQWMNAVFIDGHIEGAQPDGKRGWNRND